MEQKQINVDELKDIIRDAVNEKVETAKPVGKWGYFKSIPRPLLKYIAIPLIPYGLLVESVGEHKFNSLLLFIALLYGIRGMEKGFDTYNKRNDSPYHYQPEYRQAPRFDSYTEEPAPRRPYD